jgi:hypothetical protein
MDFDGVWNQMESFIIISYHFYIFQYISMMSNIFQYRPMISNDVQCCPVMSSVVQWIPMMHCVADHRWSSLVIIGHHMSSHIITIHHMPSHDITCHHCISRPFFWLPNVLLCFVGDCMCLSPTSILDVRHNPKTHSMAWCHLNIVHREKQGITRGTPSFRLILLPGFRMVSHGFAMLRIEHSNNKQEY